MLALTVEPSVKTLTFGRYRKYSPVFPWGHALLQSGPLHRADWVISLISCVAQEDGRGAAHTAVFVVNVADIQFRETEPETVDDQRSGHRAEEYDRFLTLALAEGIGFRKFLQAADDDLDFTGNRHAYHRFLEEIGGHLVISDDEAGGPQKRDPGLQNLTVNQPVVDPYKGYVHRILQSIIRRLSCLEFRWPARCS